MILNLFQKVDNIFSYLFANTCNEKKFLKKILNNKQIVFVDIGANVGSYTDFIIKNFNIHKGYLFEPSSSAYEILKKKFKKKKNISINNVALSKSKGKTFFYDYELSSQSSFYKLNKKNQSFDNLKKKYLVNFERLDKLYFSKKNIDLCKIDAQGEDLNIIKGMSNFLNKKKINILKVELTFDTNYQNSKNNFLDIVTYLSKYNYNLVNFTKIKYSNDMIVFCDAYFIKKK